MPRLAMRCSAAEVFTVLSHFERKGGFEITRLVARPNGEAFIELAAGAGRPYGGGVACAGHGGKCAAIGGQALACDWCAALGRTGAAIGAVVG